MPYHHDRPFAPSAESDATDDAGANHRRSLPSRRDRRQGRNWRAASKRKPLGRPEIKVVPIGNSRGVRLPKATLAKYSIKESVLLEERAEVILLRNKNDKRLSWEEAFQEMAREREDWSDLDAAIADGLDKETW